MFPSLRGRVDLAFSDPAATDLTTCDCVFFATPNAVAMTQAAALLDSGVRVIDLSADFRFQDAAAMRASWRSWPSARALRSRS